MTQRPVLAPLGPRGTWVLRWRSYHQDSPRREQPLPTDLAGHHHGPAPRLSGLRRGDGPYPDPSGRLIPHPTRPSVG